MARIVFVFLFDQRLYTECKSMQSLCRVSVGGAGGICSLIGWCRLKSGESRGGVQISHNSYVLHTNHVCSLAGRKLTINENCVLTAFEQLGMENYLLKQSRTEQEHIEAKVSTATDRYRKTSNRWCLWKDFFVPVNNLAAAFCMHCSFYVLD